MPEPASIPSPPGGGASIADVRRRVTEEHGRCATTHTPFWVMAVDIPGLDRLERDSAGASAAVLRALVDTVRSTPHAERVHAWPIAGGLLMAATGLSETDAEAFGRHMRKSAPTVTVANRPRPFRCRPNIGLARDPGDDPIAPETLALVALKGAEIARNRGGDVVHTKVYGLMQRRSRDEAEKACAPPAWVDDEATMTLVPATPTRTAATPAAPTPAAAPAPEVMQAKVKARVEAVVAEAAASATTATASKQEDPDIEGRLRAMAERITAEALEQARHELAAASTPAASAEELDRLRRRITKLNTKLEETERRLEQATAGTGEDGVASAFRSVQGLPEGEKDFTLKMTLLKDIAEANVELRRLIDDMGGRDEATAEIPRPQSGQTTSSSGTDTATSTTSSGNPIRQ